MNILNNIPKYVTALFDGTCYNHARQMTQKQLVDTAIKMLACALMAGIIVAFFNPVLMLVMVPLAALTVFIADTYEAPQRRGLLG